MTTPIDLIEERKRKFFAALDPENREAVLLQVMNEKRKAEELYDRMVAQQEAEQASYDEMAAQAQAERQKQERLGKVMRLIVPKNLMWRKR